MVDTLGIDAPVAHIRGEHGVGLLTGVLHGVQIEEADMRVVLPDLEGLHAAIPYRHSGRPQLKLKQLLRQPGQCSNHSTQGEVLAKHLTRLRMLRQCLQMNDIPRLHAREPRHESLLP
ncbi:hypothetical protein D3C76_1573850 [compost metagenome]